MYQEASSSAKAMLDTGGNATERALSASGSKDPRFHKMFLEACSNAKAMLATDGNATEHAASAADIKDSRLEQMYLEACSNAPSKIQSLLQELHALGRYPNRYKQPANKMETDSNSLAKKLTQARTSFTPAVEKYVEAMRSTSTSTEHAQKA